MTYKRGSLKILLAAAAITYGMIVEVTGGFYKGCYGKVEDVYEPTVIIFPTRYEVNLHCGDDYAGRTWINKENLQEKK